MDGNRVIEIILTSEDPILISLNTDKEQLISMTYSVEWKYDNSIEFRHRFDRYLDLEFFEHETLVCIMEFIYVSNIFSWYGINGNITSIKINIMKEYHQHFLEKLVRKQDK